MKIQELLPHLKKGWVAMSKDNIWVWFSSKPMALKCSGFWDFPSGDGEYVILGYIFDLDPFDGDWKDSLMKCGGNSIKWNSKDIMPHPKDTHHIITKSGFEYQWLPTRDWKNPKNNGWYSYETDKMFVDCPEDWIDYDVWKKSLFMKCGEKK